MRSAALDVSSSSSSLRQWQAGCSGDLLPTVEEEEAATDHECPVYVALQSNTLFWLTGTRYSAAIMGKGEEARCSCEVLEPPIAMFCTGTPALKLDKEIGACFM